MGQIAWHKITFPFTKTEIPASEKFTNYSLFSICVLSSVRCSQDKFDRKNNRTARMLENAGKNIRYPCE